MTAGKEKAASFEEGMNQLESIAASLGSGEMTLEEAVAAYEQGMALAHALEERLTSYRKRIEQIDPETGKIAPFKEASMISSPLEEEKKSS